MILTISINKLQPNTTNGFQLKLTLHYSSFDKKEIDELEKLLRETYHNNSVTEYKPVYNIVVERGEDK